MPIHIANPKQFEHKKQQFKKAGINQLRVVADFDQTFTKGAIPGKRSRSTVSQVRDGNYISPEYVKEANALFQQYHPTEIDPTLTKEQKIPIMDEWWKKHLEVFVRHGMTRQVFEKIIADKKIEGREQLPALLDFLAKHHIPLVIFSGGLGDLILLYLQSIGKWTPNIHIISNFYRFDKAGKVTGTKSEPVHSQNKDETLLRTQRYYKEMEQRKSVLLLGDSIADASMVDDALRIGFLLNPKRLDAFAKVYDVLILDDGPLDFVVDLLKELYQ